MSDNETNVSYYSQLFYYAKLYAGKDQLTNIIGVVKDLCNLFDETEKFDKKKYLVLFEEMYNSPINYYLERMGNKTPDKKEKRIKKLSSNIARIETIYYKDMIKGEPLNKKYYLDVKKPTPNNYLTLGDIIDIRGLLLNDISSFFTEIVMLNNVKFDFNLDDLKKFKNEVSVLE